MSVASLATVSDDTITPSTFQHCSDFESSTPSLEFSVATTACNTISESRNKGHTKDESDPHKAPTSPFRKRPFQRLPIPTSLLLTPTRNPAGQEKQKKAEDGLDSISIGVKLGYGPPAPFDHHLVQNDEGEREDFPQSPGHSPLSQFRQLKSKDSISGSSGAIVPRRFSLSPRSGLRIGLRRKESRNRSASDASLLQPTGKQLYPSPPPAQFSTLHLEPEDLVQVPKKKVLKRKPIPTSLFVEAQSSLESRADKEKERSWSVPDIFTGTCFDNEHLDVQHDLGGNHLGLFLSNPLLSTDSSDNSNNDDGSVEARIGAHSQSQSLDLPPFRQQQQPRLRRTTRSISESYHRQSHSNSNVKRSASQASHSGADVVVNLDSSGELSPSDLPDSPDSCESGEKQGREHRGRTRSGSAPVFSLTTTIGSVGDELHTRAGEGEKGRRYSEQSPYLRRVSRTKKGEMRSVYLHSHPAPSSCSASTPSPSSCFHSLRPPSPQESESVEVLRTPDPPSQSKFSTHRDFMSSSLSSLTPSSNSLRGRGGGRAFDTMRSSSSADGSWDGSLASRARSSSETSMASLLVLQQHIQQRNHLRQFAPPSADPHLSTIDFAAKRRSRQQHQPSSSLVEDPPSVLGADKDIEIREDGVKVELGTRLEKEEEEKGQEVDEEGDRWVRQFGAIRIKNWTSTADDEECELPHLVDDEWRKNDETEKEVGGRVAGVGGGGMRLRHMFSNPLFPTTSSHDNERTDGSKGSLRERRAKPPISIALAPPTTTAATSNNAGSSVSAVIIGAAIPLRKKISRGQLSSSVSCLSPSIHSPPPCPPPATPLPELPPPKSAPLIPTATGTTTGGAGSTNRPLLLPKRSFIRSSSTPVSPLIATATHLSPGPSQQQKHGVTKSQGQNFITSPLPLTHQHHLGLPRSTASIPASATHETWNDDSMLTPPLTGGLPMQLMHDRQQQPNTPLSATTDSSMIINTPIKPTATTTAAAGKFDSLLAFLSSSSSSAFEGGDKDNEKGSPRSVTASAHDERNLNIAVAASNEAALTATVMANGVVYGLAL